MTQVDTYANVQAWSQWSITQVSQNVNLNNSLAQTSQAMDPTNPSTCVVTLTSLVQSWYNGTLRNYGVNLEPHYYNPPTQGMEFYSNQAGLLSELPSLAVTYSTLSDPSNPSLAGLPRPWQAGIALNPLQTLNLANGNVTTILPITGWSGFGPSVALSLVHNSQNAANDIVSRISYKWQTNYNTRLVLTNAPASITRIGPDGSRDAYTNPVTSNGMTT